MFPEAPHCTPHLALLMRWDGLAARAPNSGRRWMFREVVSLTGPVTCTTPCAPLEDAVALHTWLAASEPPSSIQKAS